MRKLSFLAITCTAVLAISSCTKDNSLAPLPPANVSQNPYSVIHSDWTGIETFGWAEGSSSSIPSQESNWSVPELTTELLDKGSTVLLFAKSKDSDEVEPMPVAYVSGPTDNIVDFYDAQVSAGNLLLMHTMTVDGNHEMPVDLNNVNLRYVIVTENTYALGRSAVVDFRSMSYKELVTTLNIPE